MGPKAINFAKNNNYLMMDELINALVNNSLRYLLSLCMRIGLM